MFDYSVSLSVDEIRQRLGRQDTRSTLLPDYDRAVIEQVLTEKRGMMADYARRIRKFEFGYKYSTGRIAAPPDNLFSLPIHAAYRVKGGIDRALGKGKGRGPANTNADSSDQSGSSDEEGEAVAPRASSSRAAEPIPEAPIEEEMEASPEYTEAVARRSAEIAAQDVKA